MHEVTVLAPMVVTADSEQWLTVALSDKLDHKLHLHLERGGAPRVAEFVVDVLEELAPAIVEMKRAMQRALPLLEQLGNFIGNGPIDASNPDNSLGERCDAILALKRALGEA